MSLVDWLDWSLMTASISSIYYRLPWKAAVNIQRANRITLQRKLRLASFVNQPRLVKGFHNNPRLEVK